MTRRLRSTRLAWVLAGASLLTACGDDGGTYVITEVRDRGRPNRIIPSDVTDGDRLLGRKREMTYEWTTPEGWKALDENPNRIATYEVPGTPPAECVISSLPGDAGGELANINRWCKQMKHDPIPSLSDDAVQWLALEGLKQDAIAVDLTGTYVGMRGNEELENARMLVGLVPRPGHTLFVKMIGVDAVVNAAGEDFRALLHSLVRTGDAAPHTMDGHGGMGHGGGPIPPPPKETPVAKGLHWSAPDGWASRRTPGATRLGTLKPSEDSEVECTVTVLRGDGGGLHMNVNRWAEQMQHARFSEDALEKLDTIEVLGVDGRIVEIPGHYRGMKGESVDDALMLALVCFVDQEAVFVKMTGPRDEVAALKDTFLALCRSLRLEA